MMTDTNRSYQAVLSKLLGDDTDLNKRIEVYLDKIPENEKDEIFSKFLDFVDGKITWAQLRGIPRSTLKHLAQLGYYNLMGGEYDRAESIFKGLSIIDHNNWYYRSALGTLYQKQKQYQKAIEEYSMALRMDESEISSLTNRGECYLHLGSYDEAKEDLEKVIGLDPKGENKWCKRARVLLTLLMKLNS